MKIKLAGQGQFYTITNLQGSQTEVKPFVLRQWFYTITNLQGSQTWWLASNSNTRFTPLQTYKVLKLLNDNSPVLLVLHHYKLTRFSNITLYAL